MRAPHTRLSPVLQIFLGALAGVAAVATAGAVYQAASTALDRRRLGTSGTLVDIGRGRLHVDRRGEGSPTVILEAGELGTSAAWAWVQEELAKLTRVIAYDRAGLGWSDASAEPHDALHVVDELRALLDRTGTRGPYVLVGHAMGGLFMRAFAALYPDEVAGVVLVDPVHPDQPALLPASAIRARQRLLHDLRLAPALARFGVARASGAFARITRGLPPDAAARLRASLASPKHLRAGYEELAAWSSSFSQARALRGLGDTPLVVLSATEGDPEVMPLWHAMHQDLVRLSTAGEHRYVEGADRWSIVTEPRYAREVVTAAREMVLLARVEKAAEVLAEAG